ncbi:MAG: hypothetical protein KBT34_06600, partial [Prevotella sp.]|nr:hypothetical protein [Candidatus Prevotella equi]
YDQGRTEGCWIYAMLACIEREQQLRGDSVTLSRQWLMSKILEEQMDKLEIENGKWKIENGKWEIENGKLKISLRGVGKDVLRLIERYGLVPYSMEKSRINNSRVLQRKLSLLLDDKSLTPQSLRKKSALLLPRFTVATHTVRINGKDTEESSFYYYSMRYTPQQFAQSIMHWQHWHFYATDARQPWHKSFVIDVPDNRQRHTFVNLPPEELLDKIKRSLSKGHPVYWEISKKADAGDSNHAMAIVALRKGRDGKARFLCLNSYGKEWGNNGYCLVTANYLMHHICNVGIIE